MREGERGRVRKSERGRERARGREGETQKERDRGRRAHLETAPTTIELS